MIEVIITHDELLRWWDTPGKPGYLTGQQWAALHGRQKLIDAGIPLRAVVDPLSDTGVTYGRLEWWDSCLDKAKLFRWYPPTEAAAPPP